MRRCLAVFLLAFAGWLPAWPALAAAESEAIDRSLATAREALGAGDAVRAQAALEAAYRAGARNPALCLAAAEVVAATGDKVRSTVWLLRGWRLAPADPGIGKALAALEVDLPGPPTPLAARLGPRDLVWLALAGNTVFWLVLALGCGRRRRLARPWVLLAGGLAAWLWLEAGLALAGPWLWPVAVIRRDVAAASAPESGAEPLFPLTAGQVVAFGPIRDGYQRITVAGDRLGWLPVSGLDTGNQ